MSSLSVVDLSEYRGARFCALLFGADGDDVVRFRSVSASTTAADVYLDSASTLRDVDFANARDRAEVDAAIGDADVVINSLDGGKYPSGLPRVEVTGWVRRRLPSVGC